MYMNNLEVYDIVGLVCDFLVISRFWIMEILILCLLLVKKNVYNRIYYSYAEGLLLVAYYDVFVSLYKFCFCFKIELIRVW